MSDASSTADPAPEPSDQPEVFVEGLYFAESPRWHEGRFWASDFFAHRVLSVGMDGRVTTEVSLDADEQPSGLGWLPDGRLLISAMTQRQVLRHDGDGRLVVHADLSDVAPFHLNDMLVDAAGRAWVGNFGFDLDAFLAEYGPEGALDVPGPIPTSLVRVDPDGTVSRVVNDLAFPNGMVITPDRSTLIVAQSLRGELTAFSLDEQGGLSQRRVWASLFTDTDLIAPDGICIDDEGGVWVADALGSGVARVVEGGAITHRVATSQPAFACMLGGPERRHLLMCTAPSSVAAEAAAAPLGKLEILEVDVPGGQRP